MTPGAALAYTSTTDRFQDMAEFPEIDTEQVIGQRRLRLLPREATPDDENADAEFELDDEDATPVGEELLARYMRQLRRYPKLTREQELELHRRYREGDAASGERLVSSYLRLVVKLALAQGRHNGLEPMDLIQAGNVGLMRSLRKFSPDKGVRFGYYASYWIKAHFWIAILENARMVKLATTQNQRRLFFNLERVRRSREAQGLDASRAALARELEVGDHEVELMEQRLSGGDQSLDAPLTSESGFNRQDSLADECPLIEEQLGRKELSRVVRASVDRLLPDLDEKESALLRDRLLAAEPLTLREIGERFGLTRERMRQVESKVLAKLQSILKSHGACEEWLSLIDG